MRAKQRVAGAAWLCSIRAIPPRTSPGGDGLWSIHSSRRLSSRRGHKCKWPNPEYGPDPMEALGKFLSEHDEFVVDERCERFLMTLNPKGYLNGAR